MAATHADHLEVVHTDGRVSRYTDVTYCPWQHGDAVTVYQDGGEIEHTDVLDTIAQKAAR
jgi:hypothetical protein